MKSEEEYIVEILEVLRAQYIESCKPYIDKLVKIRSMRPPDPIISTLEQAKALGISLMDQESTR